MCSFTPSKFIAYSIYMDFFYDNVPPPCLTSVYFIQNALGVFCSCLWIYMLFYTSRLELHIPYPRLSFLCLHPYNSHLGKEENKQLLLVPHLFSHLTAWNKRCTNTNMRTPVQHHILQGECLLTQIWTHWSHPQRDDTGEFQVNIAVYRHVSKSTAWPDMLIDTK